jgi:P pilus assembly chaperone PapD
MKLRLAPALLFSVICLLSSRLAAGTLVSGPMLGYQAHREVFLWVETKDAQQVTLDYWLAGRPETKKTLEHTKSRSHAGRRADHDVPPRLAGNGRHL